MHIDLQKRRNHFVSQSKNAEVILIYFAGHGVRFDLNTFLVPTSAAMDEGPPADFLGRCLECNTLMGYVIAELPKAKKIFIFDSCRSDLQATLKRDALSLYRPPAEPQFGPDELVVFGTALDKTAADEEQTFTQELINDLTDTTRPLPESVRRACERVSAERYEFTPQIRHAGSSFEGWYLKSGQSEYKAVAPGVKPYALAGVKGNITALAISRTGKYFAAAAGNVGDIRVVTAHEFSPSRPAKANAKVYSVDFSPSGDRLVLGCKDGSIALWNHQSEPQPAVIRSVFGGPVNHVEWARLNDRIVAVSTDRTLRVFDDRLEELARATAHKSWIWSASIHKDGGFVVTGSRDRSCRLWHLDRYSMGELQQCGPTLNFGAPVRSVRFSNNGQRLAVGTQDGNIVFYEFDVNSGNLTREAVIYHNLSAKRADKAKLVEALNHYRTYKKLPNINEMLLGRSVFVIALDFSPDDMVLAYGTNIDGYFIYALDLEQRIASMEDIVGEERLLRYRAGELRYCRHRRRLYAASGPKLHCLYY
jgi:hypothetical protein